MICLCGLDHNKPLPEMFPNSLCVSAKFEDIKWETK